MINRTFTFLIGLVGIAIAIIFIVQLTSGISSAMEPLDVKATMASATLPQNMVKIALSDDHNVKQFAELLVEQPKPYELAVRDTSIATTENLNRLKKIISSEEINAGLFDTLLGHCNMWRALTDPTKESFVDIANSYYSKLEGIGSPTQVSQDLYENLDTINKLCGEMECPDTRTCASCWELQNAYIERMKEGDEAGYRSIINLMIEKDCGGSCARLCDTITQKIEMARSSDPETRKAFLSMGIQLN